jgi:hypothetical protein
MLSDISSRTFILALNFSASYFKVCISEYKVARVGDAERERFSSTIRLEPLMWSLEGDLELGGYGLKLSEGVQALGMGEE